MFWQALCNVISLFRKKRKGSTGDPMITSLPYKAAMRPPRARARDLGQLSIGRRARGPRPLSIGRRARDPRLLSTGRHAIPAR